MNPTTSAPTRVMLALASLATVAASCNNNAGAEKAGRHGECRDGDVDILGAAGSADGDARADGTRFSRRSRARQSGGTVTFEFRPTGGSTATSTSEAADGRTRSRAGDGRHGRSSAPECSTTSASTGSRRCSPRCSISSYELQRAVFEVRDRPTRCSNRHRTASMSSVSRCFPGDCARSSWIDHPFLSADRLRRTRSIGVTQPSEVSAARPYIALGATPLDIGPRARHSVGCRRSRAGSSNRSSATVTQRGRRLQ